ncbi:quemao protein [Suillus ampliporus]|nr:quemao protein [Suillus ampliporus]
MSSSFFLLGSLSFTLDSQWSQAHESLVSEPFTYITSKPGKGICTLLFEALNIWLAVTSDQLKVIDVIQLLHNASLVIDDIEDDTQLRRGRPVTYKIYGVLQTINTTNYVYFLAYKELVETGRGQVYFQIRDDYRNLQSPDKKELNVFSGTATIRASQKTSQKANSPSQSSRVRADDGNRVVMSVLQKRPTMPTLKHHAIDYLRTETRRMEIKAFQLTSRAKLRLVTALTTSLR